MKKLIIILLIIFLFSANNVAAAVVVDSDSDGLNDELELKLGTDPQNIDSDNDSFKDGEEVFNGYNPLAGEYNQAVDRTVKVDLNTQQMKYYFNNILVGVAPVSTGRIGYDTPTGKFKIIRKIPVYRYVGPGYDLPNTKWNLEFKRSYYLHGAYWHNQFGIRPMSHGCVNVGYKDAEKIYKFLKVGDSVQVSGKTPRGSLVKKK